MRDLFKLINDITPEIVSLLKMRYDILNTIHFNQPIGRRALSSKLKESERVLRRELDTLRKNDFLDVRTDGVSLTEKAEDFLNQLQPLLREALGITYLEKELTAKLSLTGTIIVPGDIDEDTSVILDLGRAAANYIKENLTDNTIIAVTGGWTIARVTEMVTGVSYPKITVVPARGGLGERVETQANTIAAKLAGNLDGNYKMLHIPENLEPKALKALLMDSRIKKVVDIIKRADILLYGVGRADVMAKRRGLSGNHIGRLLTKGAVSEALGYYFNEEGEIVDKAPSLGLGLSDLNNLSLSIAVGGGKRKALALVAALRKREGQVLITDQGAAQEILELCKAKNDF